MIVRGRRMSNTVRSRRSARIFIVVRWYRRHACLRISPDHASSKRKRTIRDRHLGDGVLVVRGQVLFLPYLGRFGWRCRLRRDGGRRVTQIHAPITIDKTPSKLER